MSMPFVLPSWLPWWVPILVLVPAILYALLFLLMPFSVIGVKGRLDLIEARMDEIQGEIRTLSLRLGEPVRGAFRPDEDAYDRPPVPVTTRAAAYPSQAYAQPSYVQPPASPPAYQPSAQARPPVPPAAEPDHDSYDDAGRERLARSSRPMRESPPRPPRTEPRF